MAEFNPGDYELTIKFSEDKSEESPFRRISVAVERPCDREARLQREEEERAAWAARMGPTGAGTLYEEEEEDDVPRGIARISGLEINRHICGSGAFHDLLDAESDELMRFALLLFDSSGRLKNELLHDDYYKGSGCFGRDFNQGLIFYLDTVEVDREVCSSS